MWMWVVCTRASLQPNLLCHLVQETGQPATEDTWCYDNSHFSHQQVAAALKQGTLLDLLFCHSSDTHRLNATVYSFCTHQNIQAGIIDTCLKQVTYRKSTYWCEPGTTLFHKCYHETLTMAEIICTETWWLWNYGWQNTIAELRKLINRTEQNR